MNSFVLNLLTNIVCPLIRTLPGKKYLFKLLPSSDEVWKNIMPNNRVFFDNHIKAWVFADLAWSFSRRYYFYGRYPADSVELLIESWLNEGDIFIDIGGHWGIYSLTGSRTVGTDGKVFIFEPNPYSAQIIQSQIFINDIQNCELYTIGLSENEAELELQMPSGTDSSWFTFRSLDKGSNGIKVPVKRADQIFSNLPEQKKILVKIDTEGFEHQVIRGFGELRKNPNIAFIVEITNEWLQVTGTSAKQLFSEMSEEGFSTFYLTRWRSGLKRGITLHLLTEPADERQYEVVFARKLPESLSSHSYSVFSV